MHTNNTSTSATVHGGRHTGTELISISARPQVTLIRPWYDTYGRMKVGFNETFIVEGYSLKKTTAVYISAGVGVYDNTSPLSAISLYSPFSNASPLTGKDLLSLYPPFSGFKLDNNLWHISNDNIMTVTLSATQVAGPIDLIILNLAGYSVLSKDLNGSTIKAVE